MTINEVQGIAAAEICLPCASLDDTLSFFTTRLGFRLEEIFPADDPALAVIAGHGLRIRLERGNREAPGVIRLRCDDPAGIACGQLELAAPNGTRIELVQANPAVDLPPLKPSFYVSNKKNAAWGVGRAGMQYRDLIPDRQGGYAIASHIRIPQGGPVPDIVHFHKVRFQMIYCYKGWVDLLYEDQGPMFRMHAGDCILQPPEIRHRVVESSPGLEVIEVGSPADHLTCIDHDLLLPTAELRPDRVFNNQRFVHHREVAAVWRSRGDAGVEICDTGIGEATDGFASVQVVRFPTADDLPVSAHVTGLLFVFVLSGAAILGTDTQGEHALCAGDSAVIPHDTTWTLNGRSSDLELLEVTIASDST